MAYIYEITNDINNKSYVGKTEFSIEKRFQEHCQDAFRNRYEKRPLYAAMRKYGIEHFKVSLLEETTEPEEREIYWISQKQSYATGYNATLGGDGKKYLDYDLVVNTYLRLNNVALTAKELSICSKTVRRILRSKKIYIKSSSQVLVDKVGKPINQYTKDGKFIQSFVSSIEAGRALGKIKNERTDRGAGSHIAAVCRGERKSAYGYIWKYQD